MLKNHGLVNGLSWWYAEANAKGCTGNLSTGWYNAGLFDNETGKALPALYELKNFADGSADISQIVMNKQNDNKWYTIDGRRLNGKPSRRGIYIFNNQKIVIRN